MQAQDSEVILWRRHSNLNVSQRYELSPRENVVEAEVIEIIESVVQVDLKRSMVTPQDHFRVLKLVRMNADVDVRIWPQSLLGIQPRCCPTLDQDRINAGGIEECESLGDVPLVN